MFILKIALFAFEGDPMCFVHVLLNALDLHEKGHDVKVIIEGAATKLIETNAEPFTTLYKRLKEVKLVDCVCKACAAKMKSLEAAQEQALPICDDMNGHPSMARYLEEGYQIITF
ncbi:MAG: DsrE family protein [Candidatus Thorarchaeota archaeon]